MVCLPLWVETAEAHLVVLYTIAGSCSFSSASLDAGRAGAKQQLPWRKMGGWSRANVRAVCVCVCVWPPVSKGFSNSEYAHASKPTPFLSTSSR